MALLEGANILLTGGTGSFGTAFIRHALDHLNPRRLVVLSRDELKQYEARQRFGDDPRLRWFIGDVRDRRRLKRAMHDVDFVVHAAALKQVDTGEYNPFEFVQTNVTGAQHVIEAAIDCGVQRVVALSTDKASSPINLYGATKLCSDRMFISANHYASGHPTRFAVVRYGNVMGSRGSVIPYFQALAARGEPLPLTDLRMTRFWITLRHAVEFVVRSFDRMSGGELYVPRIPSMRLVDLARVIGPDCPLKEVGMRPGEKLHEEMISVEDARRTMMLDDRYVVMPHIAGWGYAPPTDGTLVPDGFAYRSDTNDLWLSPDDLRAFVA